MLGRIQQPVDAVVCPLTCLPRVSVASAMTAMSTLRVSKKARGANPMMMLPQITPGMMNGMMNGMMPGMMGGMMMPPMMSQQTEDSDEDDQPVGVAPVAKAGLSGVPAAASSGVPAVAPSASAAPSGEPSGDVHERQGDGVISRSVTYVRQVPRNRLSETLECVSHPLDAPYTSELSMEGLLILLWLFCRIKPTVKISDLRVLADQCDIRRQQHNCWHHTWHRWQLTELTLHDSQHDCTEPCCKVVVLECIPLTVKCLLAVTVELCHLLSCHISGVTTFKEFTQRMVASHRRIKDAVSPEVFQKQVTNRFGLVLDDEAMQAIAADLGWSDTFLVINRRRAKAPPPKSGDLTAMFAPAGSPMPSPLMNPLMPPPMGPNMVTPPPPPRAATVSPKSSSPVSRMVLFWICFFFQWSCHCDRQTINTN